MNSLVITKRKISLMRSIFAAGKKAIYSLRERSVFANYNQYKKALLNKESGRIIISTKDGLRFTIRRNIWDARILKEIFIKRPYIKFCKLQNNPVIVDIGGYIGDFTIYCAKYFKPLKVIVYEPTKENYNLLLENVKLNGFQNIILPVNKAVGISGELILNVQSLTHEEVHVSSYWHEGLERRRIESVSIDELYSIHNLNKVDLLKIDCEGGEYDIILNASDNVLDITQNIVFEFHTIQNYISKLDALKRRLSAKGFVLYCKGNIISACRR